ncbi:MAG: hypothetical protein FWF68_06710 [Spirochaetes bacterium]|nr:hypothetical protein [Spirochaetota bacterium]
MKTNKIIFLLITAFILAFTSCGDKDKDSGDTYLGQRLTKGAPSSAKLAQYDIPETTLSEMFNSARAVDTSDANYKGYFEESESGTSMLYFIWSNKDETKYNAVKTTLSSELGTWTDLGDLSKFTDEFPAGTVLAAGGTYSSNTKAAVVILFKKAYDDVPAGTMAVGYLIR